MKKVILVFVFIFVFLNIFLCKLYFEKSSIVNQFFFQNLELNEEIEKSYKIKDMFIVKSMVIMNLLEIDLKSKDEKNFQYNKSSMSFIEKMNNSARKNGVKILSMKVMGSDDNYSDDLSLKSCDVSIVVSGKNDIEINKFLLNGLLKISGYLEFLEYGLRKNRDISIKDSSEEVVLSLRAKLYFIY